jgi:hypothetical protein
MMHWVKRLLQLGTLLFIVTTFIVPIAELFDTWDAPGPEDDTELGLLSIVLVICLVLLVSKLLLCGALLVELVSQRCVPRDHEVSNNQPDLPWSLISSIYSPPLRI